MTPEETRVHDAYLDAAIAIATVVGHPEWTLGAAVDTDKLPAVVVNAGRSALQYLAVAIGLLDPDPDAATAPAIDPDEFLRRLTESGK